MAACYISDDEGGTVCDRDDPDGTTCGSKANQFYFITFVLLCQLLLINIIVAVIVDNFEFLYMDSSHLQVQHLQAFVDAWRVLDPTGTGKLHHRNLARLLTSIPPPLGLGHLCPAFLVKQFMAKLPIALDADYNCSFRQTLVALIRVRLDLWLFDFPDENHLIDIFRFLAPDAEESSLQEVRDPPSSKATVKFVNVISRLQWIFRVNRRAKIEGEMLHHYSQQLSLAQQKFKADPSSGNGAILYRFSKEALGEISKLQIKIDPALLLGVTLVEEGIEQENRIKASGGRKFALRGQWLRLTGRLNDKRM